MSNSIYESEKNLDPQPVWFEKHRITAYEVDFQKRVKLTSILDLMQETAGRHAANLGYGWDDFIVNKRFWVLSRLKIVMHKQAAWGDELYLQTWPKKIVKLFAYRDFRITNQNQEHIASASTSWLIVDAEKKRPLRPHNVVNEAIIQNHREALHEDLEKIEFDLPENPHIVHKVRYGDLDSNQHVNNAAYAKWIENYLNIRLLTDKSIQTFEINFVSETPMNEEVRIYIHPLSKDEFLLAGKKSNDQENFRARVTLARL